jgi:hypothetical protein
VLSYVRISYAQHYEGHALIVRLLLKQDVIQDSIQLIHEQYLIWLLLLAEAAKLGIARVLIELNPELRPALKAAGQLTRDPRSVERKKFGHKKARRSFQFSKR